MTPEAAREPRNSRRDMVLFFTDFSADWLDPIPTGLFRQDSVNRFQKEMVAPHNRFVDAPVHRAMIDSVAQDAFVSWIARAEKRLAGESGENNERGVAIVRCARPAYAEILELPKRASRNGGPRTGQRVCRAIGRGR